MTRIPREVGRRALDLAFPAPDPFAVDPCGWVEKKLRRFIWSKQREILESVRDNRFTAVPSCHGPGKSFIGSCAAGWWIDAHPPGDAEIVTTAPTDHQVKAILWKEIARRHREAEMGGRITLEAKWYRGKRLVDEELIGFGRKPQDYNAEAFQGIHAKYVLIIIDEGCGVPKALFDALETLMTNEYARMLVIGNPDDPTSYFEQICRPGSGWNTIWIPASCTPNFTGEHCPSDVKEQLVTPMWVEERKKKWGEGSPLYQSKVLAQFPEISNDTLITPQMIRLAQQHERPGLGMGTYGFDIARYGPDETVGYRNRDGVIRNVYSARMQPTDRTADAIHMFLNMHGANYVPAVVDVVGLGAGVVDELRRRNLNVIPFNGGESPIDGKRFRNLRAECYWLFREMFEKQEVDLDVLDEDLAAQLTSIKWTVDRWGRIMLESKEDMRRRGLPSPDRADGAMMTTTAGPAMLQRLPQIVISKNITSDLMKRVM